MIVNDGLELVYLAANEVTLGLGSESEVMENLIDLRLVLLCVVSGIAHVEFAELFVLLLHFLNLSVLVPDLVLGALELSPGRLELVFDRAQAFFHRAVCHAHLVLALLVFG